ncbi:1-aminocyclopropane-1-carboxylate deaminase/D-cysteine desulfhydrase [Rheinheimera sp.]|uniref:1-aminocyclopropane-1-carboxylate deaminase/D-cysteine desulfhydrase n=1 Tax=Rheinheimera sp. TaxID=1869214 RepID=UPI002FDCD80C
MSDPFYQLQWQLLVDPLLTARQIQIWVATLSCRVPDIAGNKWLKLKYHIQQIQQHNKKGILSFGGAFSNHLVALAAAGQHFGFHTVGIVRSSAPDWHNPTLTRCRELGMQLQFVQPEQYRQKQQPEFLAWLQSQYPDFLFVPEGGSSPLALPGLAELPITRTPAGTASLIACATASGGTLAGLIAAHPDTSVLGISVVKDSSLPDRIDQLLPVQHSNWQLRQEQSQKPYGKFTQQTLQFCLDLAQQQIYTEPVYSGKALHSLVGWAQQGDFAPGSHIAFFHTGGLQGLAGLYYRGLINQQQYQLLLGSVNVAGPAE